MRLMVFTLLLLCGAPQAADWSETDPWWTEDSAESLPSLVVKGWQIAGYETWEGDDAWSQNYVLHHPNERGAWWCSWLSIVHSDGLNEITASCSKLRETLTADE